MPDCSTNLPSCVNFRMWPSLAPPLPPMVRRRPLVAVAVFSAPMAEQVALLIELHDRRRLLAARAGLLVGGGFHRIERIRSVDDPDVILGVDGDANRLAE